MQASYVIGRASAECKARSKATVTCHPNRCAACWLLSSRAAVLQTVVLAHEYCTFDFCLTAQCTASLHFELCMCAFSQRIFVQCVVKFVWDTLSSACVLLANAYLCKVYSSLSGTTPEDITVVGYQSLVALHTHRARPRTSCSACLS